MTKRDARYEFIRVVSMLLVISAHALSQVPKTTALEEMMAYGLTTPFFLCNGLFFMLSGKFSLNARCERVWDYVNWYIKRLSAIGIPALVFMRLRTMHNSGWWPAYLRSPELKQDYLRNVLSAFRGTEYWFLYVLVGFLLAAPFLSKLMRALSDREVLLLLAVGMLFNSLSIYLPAFGHSFSWEFPLGGWFVLFLLGHALERLVTTPKAEAAVMVLGGLCYVLTQIQQYVGFIPGIHDLAPAYACMCAGAFLGLKKLYRPGRIRDRVFLVVGKHSLSVYLCHAMILDKLNGWIGTEGFLVPLVLRIVLTAAASLAVAFILDSTLIALLQAPLRWLQKGLASRSRKGAVR